MLPVEIARSISRLAKEQQTHLIELIGPRHQLIHEVMVKDPLSVNVLSFTSFLLPRLSG
jgi:hypothetical protein